MRYENDDVVWTALKNCPNGATGLEIAAMIGKTQASVAARLSKLYCYGFLERVPVGVKRREYKYRVKRMTAAE